jgi:hypothetical protein
LGGFLHCLKSGKKNKARIHKRKKSPRRDLEDFLFAYQPPKPA